MQRSTLVAQAVVVDDEVRVVVVGVVVAIVYVRVLIVLVVLILRERGHHRRVEHVPVY